MIALKKVKLSLMLRYQNDNRGDANFWKMRNNIIKTSLSQNLSQVLPHGYVLSEHPVPAVCCILVRILRRIVIFYCIYIYIYNII